MPTHPHESTMPLGDHLDELRRRLIIGLLGLVPLVILSLSFGTWILEFLTAPAQEALRVAGQPARLQALGPIEVFSAYLRISLVASLVAGAPWLLYQLWLFVAPGLYERERRFVYVLLPLSTILTFLGAFFLYRVVMPLLLIFLIGFGTNIGAPSPKHAPLPDGVTLLQIPSLEADPTDPLPGQAWINTHLSELRVASSKDGGPVTIYSADLSAEAGIAQHYRLSEYIGLLATLCLAFVVAFQTPVVVLLLGWSGFVKREIFLKYRRHAILICSIVAALLSPGDPPSMFAILGALYLLYELGVFLLKILPAHRVAAGLTRKQRAQTRAELAARDADNDHTP